jgi:hypothetical protein
MPVPRTNGELDVSCDGLKSLTVEALNETSIVILSEAKNL